MKGGEVCEFDRLLTKARKSKHLRVCLAQLEWWGRSQSAICQGMGKNVLGWRSEAEVLGQ